MPAPDKFDRFEKISASIEALEKTGEVAQVSMMMLNGKRDYILYCRDRERAARMLFDSFGHQGAQLEFMFDPKWSQFSDLHAMDVRK